MGRSHRIGRRGEDVAARWLMSYGWSILDRNWRAGHAELDLVARRGTLIAFVEVKTRTRESYGAPLEAVTAAKRTEVQRAAGAWLRARAECLDGVDGFRFDAVSVRLVPGRTVQVRHVPDAWRIGLE